ncbi:sensor histidine kinase [Catenulispora sp. NL8]|uniref:histidine kinase n=1 Tax=Catenulispora pinistramenti TaxID=2705254 RepID=A0ABS5KI39_9ACTN|nr:histidine kinase [Catenulispora pinistramenti]MBS2546042.1 sensor histidine kinase [Catenulispora pinistramenti]
MVWVLVGALLAACATAAWLAVRLRREQARYTSAIGERGWLLERERESAAQQAVDAERARIARELHDIVSHNVSMMLIQAGAARQVLAAAPAPNAAADAAPDGMAEEPGASDIAGDALMAVESAGRETMTELRHLLGVLAPAADGRDEAGPALAPQPTLARLSALVDKIAFAGLPVDVRISGEPRALPGGIDSTAYRVVQEALTNALKHGGSNAELTVRYDDRYLRIEILTTGSGSLTGLGRGESGAAHAPGTAGTPAASGADSPARGEQLGTGRGLLGLKERVAVYGGDLDARRRLGGGFRVRAKIPLDAP